MNYLDPFNPFDLMYHTDEADGCYKGMSDRERRRIAVCQVCGLVAAVIIGFAICALLSGCASPKQIEEHHHHYQQVDTLAIRAAVDERIQTWHQQVDSAWFERLEQYSASMTSSENQKETIAELITVTTDSLGREVRQEQRTISRDISREQRQMEQRITREYEARLSVVVDSIDGVWQSRFEELQAHLEQSDSNSSVVTPVDASADNRPWYKRLWSAIELMAIGAVVFAAVLVTRRWWSSILKR